MGQKEWRVDSSIREIENYCGRNFTNKTCNMHGVGFDVALVSQKQKKQNLVILISKSIALKRVSHKKGQNEKTGRIP